MSSSQPRIGYPRLGTTTEDALRAVGVSIDSQRELPYLTEPSESSVTDPIDESMVRLNGLHPLIQVVAHYQLGGWENAIGECWLRAGTAERLVMAVEKLPEPFGFVVYDGWRPRTLQSELYLAALDDPAIPKGFLAEPSNGDTRPAPHESGGAVDLALSVAGISIAPGTDFDDTTTRAFAVALEGVPGPDREARRMLYWTMRDAGFIVYQGEWWHFEYGTCRWATIVGQPPVYDTIQPPATEMR